MEIQTNLTPSTRRVYECLKKKSKNGLPISIRQHDLIRETGLSYGAVAAALRRLEDLGILQRMRSKKDRRRVYYVLKNGGVVG